MKLELQNAACDLRANDARCAALRRRGRVAFTMIELLISLMISAIVLAAISSVFFGALRLRSGAEDAAELTLPVDRAVDVMKQDIRAIAPPGMLAGPMGSDAIPVAITQQPLLEIFTADGQLSDGGPWADLQKVDYFLRPPLMRTSAPGQDLVRAVTRNLLPTGVATPDQQTLLSGVQTLQFSYYDGTNWNQTWTTTLSNVPLAIRVSIDFAQVRGGQMSLPVQFTVPVVSWANTNSLTNSISN